MPFGTAFSSIAVAGLRGVQGCATPLPPFFFVFAIKISGASPASRVLAVRYLKSLWTLLLTRRITLLKVLDCAAPAENLVA